jgi:hypothetical protein
MNGGHERIIGGCKENVAPFAYDQMESSVAAFLKGQADRLRRSVGKSLVQIGRDLIGAKHYLAHGAFVQWVETEIGMPVRTAQGYMKIARWAEGKSANVAHLPSSLLYLLSAQTTPVEIVDHVLKSVESGQTISMAMIRRQLQSQRDKQSADHPPAKINRSPAIEMASNDRLPSWPNQALSNCGDLIEVVHILSQFLSPAASKRVKDIMTSQRMLEEVNLPQRIQEAFTHLHTDVESQRSGSLQYDDGRARPRRHKSAAHAGDAPSKKGSGILHIGQPALEPPSKTMRAASEGRV